MMKMAFIFAINVLVAALSMATIKLVWHILDDRSAVIAVPDDAIALVKHDPNPPMMAWRPRIPDSVGTSTLVCTTGTAVLSTAGSHCGLPTTVGR